MKGKEEWGEYCKSGKKPDDIPSAPHLTYKNKGWTNWGDFLGTEYVATFDRKYMSFEEARKIILSMRLKNTGEYKEYCKSGNKPSGIPSYPNYYYKNKGWTNWGDFLGTEYVATFDRKYMSFEEAREYALRLELKSKEEFSRYIKAENLPIDFPRRPSNHYKDKGWNGWADFLGYERQQGKFTTWTSLEEAKKYVYSLELKSIEEWNEHCRKGNLPKDIPRYPNEHYKNKGWIDWADFLGNEDTRWSIRRVKELLRDLIESRIIYDFSEVRLYDLLNSKGVLNLGSASRHSDFFKKLIETIRTPEVKAIEDYASQIQKIPQIFQIMKKKYQQQHLMKNWLNLLMLRHRTIIKPRTNSKTN